ncbi:MAG: response regulator transcription factor [Flavobacteriales bacterium]
MKRKISVIVTDDHPMMRSAISSLIMELPYVERVLEADNGVHCIKHLLNVHVDVVFLDISMPLMNGLQCIQQIKADWPEVKVIVLSQFSDAKYFNTMMDLGANGYLLKSTNGQEFIDAFEKVVFEDETIVSAEIESSIESAASEGGVKLLGDREIQVLRLVSQGLNSQEVAEMLHISIHTVNSHRKALLRKSKCKTPVELIAWAKEQGYA